MSEAQGRESQAHSAARDASRKLEAYRQQRLDAQASARGLEEAKRQLAALQVRADDATAATAAELEEARQKLAKVESEAAALRLAVAESRAAAEAALTAQKEAEGKLSVAERAIADLERQLLEVPAVGGAAAAAAHLPSGNVTPPAQVVPH